MNWKYILKLYNIAKIIIYKKPQTKACGTLNRFKASYRNKTERKVLFVFELRTSCACTLYSLIVIVSRVSVKEKKYKRRGDKLCYTPL